VKIGGTDQGVYPWWRFGGKLKTFDNMVDNLVAIFVWNCSKVTDIARFSRIAAYVTIRSVKTHQWHEKLGRSLGGTNPTSSSLSKYWGDVLLFPRNRRSCNIMKICNAHYVLSVGRIVGEVSILPSILPIIRGDWKRGTGHRETIMRGRT